MTFKNNIFNNRSSWLFLIIIYFIGAGSAYLLVAKSEIFSNKFLNKTLQKKANLDFSKLEDIKNLIPVAIIGSGPAGMNAALYTSRGAFQTIVFHGSQPGGQLMETGKVYNWPAVTSENGPKIIDTNKKQSQSFGTVYSNSIVEEVDLSSWPYKLSLSDGSEAYAMSIIVATGSTPRKLNVPNESKYWGKGVTTCVVCDGANYVNRPVIVVGGGDSAVEEATLLEPYASKITILVRGSSMRAAKPMQDRLKNMPKVEVIYNTEIESIEGDDHEVKYVLLKNKVENKIYKFDVDGIFLAIGHDPNVKLFNNQLKLDKNNCIKLIPGSQETSVEGVFAAGDVSDHKYKQAGVAAGDGIKSALDAIEFLTKNGINETFINKYKFKFYNPEEQSLKELKSFDKISDLESLIKSGKPIVLDIATPECIGCIALLPTLLSLGLKYKDKIEFVKIHPFFIDDIDRLLEICNIKGSSPSLPILCIFNKGKLLDTYQNAKFTKKELIKLCNENLI